MTTECHRYAAFTNNLFPFLKHNRTSELQILLLNTGLGKIRAHIPSVVQTIYRVSERSSSVHSFQIVSLQTFMFRMIADRNWQRVQGLKEWYVQ